MEAQYAIDMTRDAIIASIFVCGPVLIVGVVIGLLIGLVQALTHNQDQTVSFVPKLIAMVLALTFCMPWIVEYMSDYSKRCFGEVPSTMSRQR